MILAAACCDGTGLGSSEAHRPASVITSRAVAPDAIVAGWDGVVRFHAVDLVVAAGPVRLLLERRLSSDEPGGWRFSFEDAVRLDGPWAEIRTMGGVTRLLASGIPGSFVADNGDALRSDDGGGAVLRRSTGTEERFDAQGRIAERRDGAGNRVVCERNAEGQVTRITGPFGNAITLTRDQEGRLVGAEGSDGERVAYQYGAAAADTVGMTRAYEYDEAGRLAGLSHPTTGREELRFDGRGRLIRRSWADGSQEVREYDDAKREYRRRDADGVTSLLRWDPDRNQVEWTAGHEQTATARLDAAGRTSALFDGREKGAAPVARLDYDSRGRLVSVKGAAGAGTVLKYGDASPLPTSVSAANGPSVNLRKDEAGRIIEAGSARGGASARFAYSPEGLLKTVTTPEGVMQSLEYDSRGRRRRIADGWGRETTFTYNGAGRVSEVREASGASTRYDYDAQGRACGETGPDGVKRSCVYGANGLPAEVSVGGVVIGRYAFDAVGRPTAFTDGEGRTTRRTYTRAGRVASIVDARGGARRFEYDDGGRLVRETDPSGSSVEFKYDARGNVVEIRDSSGRVATYGYDEAERLVRTTDLGGRASEYGYDALGRLSHVRDAEGVRRFGYGSDGRVRSVVDGAGLIEEREHDAAGRLTGCIIGGIRVLEIAYADGGARVTEKHVSGWEFTRVTDPDMTGEHWADNLGSRRAMRALPARRVIEETDSFGAVTTHQFDALGRWAATTRPGGGSHSVTRNAAGDIIQSIGPGGAVARFAYDAAGDMASVMTPDGGLLEFRRDSSGRVVSQSGASPVAFERDGAGEILAMTDGKGQTTRFRHDKQGRVIERKEPGGATVRFEYDVAGRLLAADDGRFPVRRQYTASGQLRRVEFPAVSHWMEYDYDEWGRCIRRADSCGQRVDYEYDPAGRLTLVRSLPGGEVRLTHDPAGRLAAVTYPNGVRGSWAYDTEGRATEIRYQYGSGKTLAAWRYAYDRDGNRSEATPLDGAPIRYSHDAAGQLIAEESSGHSVRYAYSASGDRMSVNLGNGEERYEYEGSGRLVRAGGRRFRHDANGNLIERVDAAGSTLFTYDDQDRLVEVALPDGRFVRYGYAPTGERIWREDGSGRVWTLWDGPHAALELDSGFRPMAAYVYGEGLDHPLLRTSASGTLSYHLDGANNVALTTGISGSVASAYEYDPFGGIRRETGEARNPLRFAAREWDPDARLYYVRARFYDPSTGRFLSCDPEMGNMADPLSWNPYAYAGNSPLGHTDPLGASRIAAAAQAFDRYQRSGFLTDRLGNGIPTARGSYSPADSVAIYQPARRLGPEAVYSVGVHEVNHRARFAAEMRSRAAQAGRPVASYSRAEQQAIFESWIKSPGVKAQQERIAYAAAARGLARMGVDLSHPEIIRNVMRYSHYEGDGRELMRDLRRIQAGVRDTVATPATLAREAAEAAARPTVATSATLAREAAETVAAPGPIRPVGGDTVIARPGTGSGISGARVAAGVGVVLGGLDLYAAAAEGATAEEILANAGSAMLMGALGSAGVYAAGTALTALAGATAAAVVAPVVAGMGAAALVAGGLQVADRIAGAPGVAADRQLASAQRANMGHLQAALASLSTRMAEAEAVPGRVREAADGARASHAAILAELGTAESALACFADIDRIVAELLGRVPATPEKKSMAESSADQAESDEERLERDLDAADALAASIQSDADAETVRNKWRDAKALAATIVTKANGAITAAAELRALRNGISGGIEKAVRDAAAYEAEARGGFETAVELGPVLKADLDAATAMPGDGIRMADEAMSNCRALRAAFPADDPAVVAGFDAILQRGETVKGILNRPPGLAEVLLTWEATKWQEIPGKIASAKRRLDRVRAEAAKFKASELDADAAGNRADTAKTLALLRLNASAGLEKIQGPATTTNAVAQATSPDAPATPNPPGTMPQGPPGTAVPAVAGLPEADAVARLNGAGFLNIVVVAANAPAPDGKAGTVEQTAPASGAAADPGDAISLYVYVGKDQAIVPGLGGLKAAEARMVLAGEGLKAAFEAAATPAPSKEKEFTVFAQSYPKGTKLPRGETVTLKIFQKFGVGDGVPGVVGLTLDEARDAVARVGMQIGGVEMRTAPAGQETLIDRIGSQSPAAGGPIPSDKAMAVVVYSKPAPPPQPDAPPAMPADTTPSAPVTDPAALVGAYRGTVRQVEYTGHPGPDRTAYPVVVRIRNMDGTWVLNVVYEKSVDSMFVCNLVVKPQGGKFASNESYPQFNRAVTAEVSGDSVSGTYFYQWKNPEKKEVTKAGKWVFEATRVSE